MSVYSTTVFEDARLARHLQAAESAALAQRDADEIYAASLAAQQPQAMLQVPLPTHAESAQLAVRKVRGTIVWHCVVVEMVLTLVLALAGAQLLPDVWTTAALFSSLCAPICGLAAARWRDRQAAASAYAFAALWACLVRALVVPLSTRNMLLAAATTAAAASSIYSVNLAVRWLALLRCAPTQALSP
jgi:hypothetical protein